MKIGFLNNKLFMQEYNTYAQDNLNWVDKFDKLRKGLFKKINSITIINIIFLIIVYLFSITIINFLIIW